MFAYCLNNPVIYCDHSGTLVAEATILSAVLIVAQYAAIAVAAALVAHLVIELIETVSEYYYEPFPVTNEQEATVYQAAPHTKNKSEKNRNKHEEGDARRKRDQGGEKKKQKKGWVPRNYKSRELN